MPKSSSFYLLFLIVILCFALPSNTRHVYIDSESTSSKPSGTQTDPYSSLQQLITILEDPTPGESIQVFLKSRATVYKISNTDDFLFDGSASTDLSVTSWSDDPLLVTKEQDCSSLPIIDGSDIRLDLESMNLVNLTSIKFINMKGSIQVKNSKAVSLNNLCLDDLPSVSQSFFNLEETGNLTVQRVIATVSNGTEIIKYTNTKSINAVQKVSIKDLTLLLINNTNKLSPDTLGESYFKFVLNNPDSLSATKNTLILSRISLQGKGTSQVFPVFASVYGWDNVHINKLDISDQDFIANRGGVLEFNSVGNLTVSDTQFYHNVIFSQSLLNLKEKIAFFYLKNVNSLSLFNTNFEKNYISGVQDIETNFRFLLSDVLGAITVKNFSAKANSVFCLMYLLRIKTINVDVPISMDFDNITIQDNENDNSNFYFLKFSEAKILSFQATNFYIAQNHLTGRLFEISTLGNINLYGLHLSDTVITHKVANFTNIAIVKNSNFTNFAMLLFRVSNPNTIPTDFVPDYEYYTLNFHNLTIEKNNFFKGVDKDWLDQLSLLQVAGAQVYIQNSTIKDSLFVSYDFLSLYKELSSVFFVNSTVENSIFSKAHFIITRYEAIMVTMGSFFNSTDGQVQALYRYGFVLDSNFTDIEISGGSLFTINNAFLLFNSNNFNRMFFLNSRLLKAGDFRPPGYNIDDVKFIRNQAVEKQSMSINPAIYDLYLSSLTLLQALYQDTVYFYLLRSNRMTRFDVFSKNLIKFEDYEAKQSFICCISNYAYDFNVPDTSTNLIDLSGSVEAFNFYRNTVDRLDGDGSILRFTSLVDNKYFMFRRNIVRNTWGPSILLASGSELSTMNITDNTVHDNIFSNSVISISFDMILLNQTVFFVNNTYMNNTIVVSDVDLNSKSAFIELSLEASRGGEFFIIDKCTFIDTTYLNNRTFLQYGQLNAMFSFLMANSSLLIRDSIFDKVNIISPGNDVFYVASSLIVVLNCTFNNHTVQTGQSIFNLVSTTGIFRNNRFNQIYIPFGKSVMYISPSPFLQEIISLDMTANQFIHCKCGLENVKISANVMLVEKANITLSLINNLFSDAFELNPVFYFLNTTFVNSVVTNSTLQSLEAKNDENFMYEVYYSSGSVQFINETIENRIPGVGTDFLIKCSESPSLSIVLSDLTWAEGSFKNSIRLADIDSGSLTILDTVIDDFTYYFRSATEGMIINAGSSKSQLSSLTIALKNVTFSNLRLIKSNPLDKSAIGVAGFMGSGEQRDTVWNFEIINCTFSGLDGVAGVYVDMPTVFNILIKDSLFNSIWGRFGTAIDFFPVTSHKSKIIVTNNTFSNNYASKAGGAVYITNSSYVMTNNTFANNKAADIGGAILLDCISRTDALMQDNIFEGNTAILGDDIASQPYKLAISFIFPNQTTVYARNGILVDEHHHPKTIRNISRVALNVSLLDLDGLPTQDTSSTAIRYIIINFKNHATITSFNCTKQYCYINSLNLTLSGLHEAPLSVTIQFFSELATAANFRLQEEISFKIHPCDAGESFNENTKTCDYCGVGTYSLDPKVACQNCPDNAYCPGGNVLMAQRGYWRANDHTAEITQCRKDGITRCNATREVSEAYMENQCNPGYTGPKCEACDFDNHFVESGLLQCKKCKNVVVSFAATMMMAIGYTFFRLYCVRKLYLANKSFCSTEGNELDKLERTESNYYVRLLLVYTQILSLLYLFHMEVREFFGEYTHFGNPSEFMLVKLECSMEFLGIPYHQFIYVSTIITLVSPILQYLAIFILAKIFAKKLFEEASEAKYFFRLSVLYLVMSEQPKVVGFMTSYLSCTEVEGFVGSFIALHPNVSCDASQYSLFKYFIVIPCLLIWTVGIPLYFFLSLFFKRTKLDQMGVRVTLGGLYNVYKTKHYYWGTVTMALQVSISYVTYAFQEDLKTSLATVFIILWTYQLVIRKHKPYGLKRFNTMESTTIGVLMLNIILGYYTLNNPFSTLKYSAYGALALVNIMMLIWIFYKIVHMKIARSLDAMIEKFSSKKRDRKSFLESSRASLLEKDHELTAEEEDMLFLNSRPAANSDSKSMNENHLL